MGVTDQCLNKATLVLHVVLGQLLFDSAKIPLALEKPIGIGTEVHHAL